MLIILFSVFLGLGRRFFILMSSRFIVIVFLLFLMVICLIRGLYNFIFRICLYFFFSFCIKFVFVSLMSLKLINDIVLIRGYILIKFDIRGFFERVFFWRGLNFKIFSLDINLNIFVIIDGGIFGEWLIFKYFREGDCCRMFFKYFVDKRKFYCRFKVFRYL